MESLSELNQLIEKFERKRHSYDEEGLRIELINPFFLLLEWDVYNTSGDDAAYQEVVHEYKLKIAGTTKKPDYSFRLGKNSEIFFVEAKRPSIPIEHNGESAVQLRHYAWNKGLPLSILTNFDRFAVYDCRTKPRQDDKAEVARVMSIHYKDYPAQWNEISSLFSKTAIKRGAFDRYAESKHRKGTTTVDVAFLEEIEDWRMLLAKGFALQNPQLSTRNLNFAVQRTIDRILFLRICEARGIEEDGQLSALANSKNIYRGLMQIFRKADERYNSGLFYFQEEKGRNEGYDKITPDLTLKDNTLKEIITRLYYPVSPYAFDVMPVEILGQVYEQFLGKVIRLTAGHQAKVEDKPEVRKAGGVYYTPAYIVNYIVERTVGKLLEGKAPSEAAKLRILDPACGSGSFLIGAFQYLLDWYLQWYIQDGIKRHRSKIEKDARGKWRLRLTERRQILLNNLYGVDIDTQAVEVTKLSLLLKALEGETLNDFGLRALPDLGNNIKCGNSLIGPDFYNSIQMTLLGEDELQRINVFDWKNQFKNKVFNQGGFDAVIGNPPYIPMESLNADTKEYFQREYTVLERKYDSAAVFILRGLSLLANRGLLGYISSVTWQTGENYAKLRRKLISEAGLLFLINLPFDVFRAYVDTGIYILSKSPQIYYRMFRFPKDRTLPNMAEIQYEEIPISEVREPENKIVQKLDTANLLKEISRRVPTIELGSLTKSTQGLAGNKYIASKKKTENKQYPYLLKGQVYRYRTSFEEIGFVSMKDKPSLAPYYEALPKLLIRRVISRQDRLLATFLDKQLVFKKDINPFIITAGGLSAYYILGIINSTLISYIYLNTSTIATKDDFRQTTLTELRHLPIRTIDLSNNKEKIQHDKMVSLVEQILKLHKDMAAVNTPDRQEWLHAEIQRTDENINQLVYELYGLTAEEIAIVEKA